MGSIAMRAVVCVLAAACVSTLHAQPPRKPDAGFQAPVGTVDLRPRFVPGQQTRYVFEQTSSNQIKPEEGEATDQKLAERIGLVMKVVEAGETGSTIQIVYETVKVTIESADGKMEFDSTKAKASKPATPPGPAKKTTPADPADALKMLGDLDENALLEQMIRPMVGAAVTVKTDRAGAITSVSGGEALSGMGGMLGGLGGGGGLPSPTQMAEWLVAGTGGPGRAGFARVGESWTNTDSLSGTPVGALRMTTTHTLKSAAGGLANIAFSGRIEPPTETGTPPASPAGAQVQKASYSGSYVWDTRSGSLSEMGTTMGVTLEGGLLGAKTRLSSDTRVSVRRQGGREEGSTQRPQR